ncbi:MAG: hypothetical protein H0U74_12175 [Bradymonadaceae bacterium]|nr:hypothetical protein [Lujinxingiaceae bacterium]
MDNTTVQKDTAAWIFQVWASFVLAASTTMVGIFYMPVEPWVKAFLAMGMLFTMGSSFTLAKTIRDNHEARRMINRVTEAKAEKILREYEFRDAA